ncbi:MAG: response regulator [Chloroflexi bacterium CFX4]|nr:response regulator [Chloroflexi bacterium CFX4]MDL1923001.1 response regulator [Chloroflexi bacterium CFX3]
MILKEKRIFYFEDDMKNRAIVQLILEREGAVMGFERWGGREVLPRLHAFAPIELILLDLMFPNGVSGYDVYDVIRAEPAFAQIPIVAISASDPAVELPKTRTKGFAGFISKPINLRDFPLQIAAVLNGQPIWHLI